MNNIKDAFLNGKACISFITAGDPSLDTTKKLILKLQKSGTDLIQIGIPFSDPIAEGPIVMKAYERSLRNGCTTDKIFDMLSDIKEEVKIPLVFMAYCNIIFTYGKDRFLEKCKETGVAGIIVPDVPYDEKIELSKECDKYGIELISMIVPASKERVETIAKEAKGFLYCMFNGEDKEDKTCEEQVKDMVKHIRSVSNIPCAFVYNTDKKTGIDSIKKLSDGAIIGDEIVDMVAKEGVDDFEKIDKYIKSVKDTIEC